MSENLTLDERKLLQAESQFYETEGYTASETEMARYIGWSKSKVKRLRKSLESKQYAKTTKDGNKNTLLLLPIALGVVGAGVGAISGATMINKALAPKEALPVITPSFTPVTTPEQQVIGIPERETLIDRQVYIDRGSNQIYSERTGDGGAYTQDMCAQLGWEWKDGQCIPPSNGDTMVGEQWCMQKLTELKAGDRIALGMSDYINQVCVINGNYYNYSILSDAICLGCSAIGKECDRVTMKCKDDAGDSGDENGTKKPCNELTFTECSASFRFDCVWVYSRNRCINRVDIDDEGGSIPPHQRCSNTGGSWIINTCHCSDGYMTPTGNCEGHTGTDEDALRRGRCTQTGGTWANNQCTCKSGYHWTDSQGCKKDTIFDVDEESASERKALCNKTKGSWDSVRSACMCPFGTIWNATNGCTAILSGNSGNCTKYTTEKTCKDAGCRWYKNILGIYQCG